MKDVIDRILVIKVGTNTLIKKVKNGSEKLDATSFTRIGEQIIQLQEEGLHIAVVSSAAITAGMVATGLKTRPRNSEGIPNLQRLASIGWRYVLNSWADALDNLVIGELLLTKHELDLRHERDEALRVTHSLMSYGNVVVINENDAITHEEIAFGDNDTLAATFAVQIAKSKLFGNDIRLVLLSDIDGVYTDINDTNSLIGHIDDAFQYEHIALGSVNTNGTGGMTTKFEAAKIANKYGIDMWVTNGRAENAIKRAMTDEIGTHFSAS